MEKLILQYQVVLKAYQQLDHMIKKLEHAKKNSQSFAQDDIMAYRDSVIKRFEFCYDLTWKYAKAYLNYHYEFEIASPKKVFQECYQQKLINEQELQNLLAMADDRNATSHIYDETMADTISVSIENHYYIMKELLKKLNKNAS